jgi:hypothetical protein
MMPFVRERVIIAIYILCTKVDSSNQRSLQLLASIAAKDHSSVESRTFALKGIESVIRNNNKIKPAGWTFALSGMENVARYAERRDEVSKGLQLLQLLIEEILHEIPLHIVQGPLIQTLLAYSLQTQDSSASLSVPTLLWSLVHYCSSLPDETGEPLWRALFELLSTMALNERENVRAGGLRTLFKMIEMHWAKVQTLSSDILLTLLNKLQTLIVKNIDESWLSTLSLTCSGMLSLPANSAPLQAALFDLLIMTLNTNQPFSLAYESKSLRASMAIITSSLVSVCPDFSLLLKSYRPLIDRAAEEAQHSSAKSTSSSRFAHYFILCDAVRILPLGNAALTNLLAEFPRHPNLLSSLIYKSAAVLYDPANFRANQLPPLLDSAAKLLQHLPPAGSSLYGVCLGLWAATPLLGIVDLFALQPHLLLYIENLPFPQFPADPPLPFQLREDLESTAQIALALLTSHGTQITQSALPLLFYVLGCLCRVNDLAAVATSAFQSCVGPQLTDEVVRRAAIDVCHAGLLWDDGTEAEYLQMAQLLGSDPLISSPGAPEALLSVAEQQKSPCAAGVALAQLLRLVADKQTSGKEVLALIESLLLADQPPVSLLESLASMQSDEAAWGGAATGETQRGHLVLLYKPLVHVCANAGEVTVRQAAGKCLVQLEDVIRTRGK